MNLKLKNKKEKKRNRKLCQLLFLNQLIFLRMKLMKIQDLIYVLISNKVFVNKVNNVNIRMIFQLELKMNISIYIPIKDLNQEVRARQLLNRRTLLYIRVKKNWNKWLNHKNRDIKINNQQKQFVNFSWMLSNAEIMVGNGKNNNSI